MEHEVLNVLSYNLVQPTSVTFLSYYLKLQHNSISSILKERVEHLSMVTINGLCVYVLVHLQSLSVSWELKPNIH